MGLYVSSDEKSNHRQSYLWRTDKWRHHAYKNELNRRDLSFGSCTDFDL
jgi:hypothetical protein